MEIMVKLGYIQRLLPSMDLRRRAEFLILLFAILAFFLAISVYPQYIIVCSAFSVGAVSPQGRKRAAAGTALRLSQMATKAVTVSVLT
jgi:energy-coupling factor transporter transmembrane protein EcfT